MLKFFRKYHKWLGVVLAYFILSFVVSGIILNHRETFSFVDLSRNLMPKNYRYDNWNNSSVKSTVKLSNDSILIYGNIGVWLTDSVFSSFQDFNNGFPKGIDNRKVCRLFQTSKNKLLAGTFFGLFEYNNSENKWIKIELSTHEKRITDIIQKQDTVIVLTRSFLLKTIDLKQFEVLELPAPENYDKKISLFKTLWVIHSGEIYGIIGKLVIDFAGLVFAFLTVTGFIVFVNKIVLKKNNKSQKKKKIIKASNRWNLKWHNKLGWITLVLLILNTVTGIFLRPPFLIAIGNSKVNRIPFTELATPNPWFDILRRVIYDDEIDRYIVATMDGFFYSDDNFKSELKKFEIQPPASIMGVNVFEKADTNTYLIGSFEGLFLWNSDSGEIIDFIKKGKYTPPEKKGRPIGEYMISGFSKDFKNKEIYFDYNSGVDCIVDEVSFVDMPKEIIKKSPISLWNFALEFHTGRIYQTIIGDFYVLVVPLVGLSVLFILISGFWVWYRVFRGKQY
ncbi:MAG: PepSY domain-containing protein [Bacteroidales bacterium]|nr:PepSY domain-containing protein [Bacteroidales bacterium]